jgi:hypothetical protein
MTSTEAEQMAAENQEAAERFVIIAARLVKFGYEPSIVDEALRMKLNTSKLRLYLNAQNASEEKND